jgi:hypothetical protein
MACGACQRRREKLRKFAAALAAKMRKKRRSTRGKTVGEAGTLTA